MVFNSGADNQDLCTLTDRLVKTTSVSFPLADKALYANMKLREIFSAIFEVYGGWVFDDTNNSGQPEATTNLVSGTQVYAFATVQMILGVEYENSSSQWYPLKPITLEEIKEYGYAESEFMNVSGNPIYYRPVKDGIKLYPAPSFSVSSGLKVFLTRDITPFTSASTSAVPGIDSMLHEGLAIGMALQYAKINSNPVAGGVMRGGFKTGLLSDWSDYLERVKTHYTLKFRNNFPPKIRHRRDMIVDYM